MLHKAERRTATTKTVRETEAEAVAFVVGKAVGLVTGTASADYVKRDEMRLVAFSEFTCTLNIVRLTVPRNVEGLSFECVLRTFRDAFRHTEGRFIK
jgi:hypothetical protein